MKLKKEQTSFLLSYFVKYYKLLLLFVRHSELPGRSDKWHGGIGVAVLPTDQRQLLALNYPEEIHKETERESKQTQLLCVYTT